ncbi:MAG: tetratricopeptide repeat protein [Pedosphaera sp.]|nr:tetratricopeptide repeat protein [Pedosphaera sp.]
MATAQEQFDDAMQTYSTGDYPAAIVAFRALLVADPNHFDALLALALALYRQGRYPEAIVEGHRAEQLRPHEQLVHTNLSLFYMRSGDKKTAEHHGLQARIASWRGNMDKPDPAQNPAPVTADAAELKMAGEAKPTPIKLPTKFPDMPWKNKKPAASGDTTPSPAPPS